MDVPHEIFLDIAMNVVNGQIFYYMQMVLTPVKFAEGSDTG